MQFYRKIMRLFYLFSRKLFGLYTNCAQKVNTFHLVVCSSTYRLNVFVTVHFTNVVLKESWNFSYMIKIEKA